MMDLPERVFQKIHFEPNSGCWLWTASIRPDGYGQVAVPTAGRPIVAHRVVYTALVGPIPEGLTLDHLCRVRHCVNPSHLEPVTNRVNILRGEAPSARQARQTHCHKGHPLATPNLYVSPRGERQCRICKNARWRKQYHRRRGQEVA